MLGEQKMVQLPERPYSGYLEPETRAVLDCPVPADSVGFFPLLLGNLSVTVDSM